MDVSFTNILLGTNLLNGNIILGHSQAAISGLASVAGVPEPATWLHMILGSRQSDWPPGEAAQRQSRHKLARPGGGVARTLRGRQQHHGLLKHASAGIPTCQNDTPIDLAVTSKKT